MSEKLEWEVKINGIVVHSLSTYVTEDKESRSIEETILKVNLSECLRYYRKLKKRERLDKVQLLNTTHDIKGILKGADNV